MTDDFFSFTGVSKKFGQRAVLEDVSLRAGHASIIGLVGQNGSGKTTLLRHVAGLYLPTRGECTTLGRPTATLGANEFAHMGMVHQHDPLIEWMTGNGLLSYVASFHLRWDNDLQRQLLATLEIDTRQKIVTMSPGNRQKLALVLAVCHRPALLLLDEPLSDLDPIVRGEVIEALLDRFRDDEMVMVISSHLLHDIERIADRIVCLNQGRVVADAPLDDLKEQYAEWTVTSASRELPGHFTEPYVVSFQGTTTRALLTVQNPAMHRAAFEEKYGVSVENRGMNLDQIFRVLADRKPS